MKGICFTEPLFHKVVKGEKTQTRRMITPQPSGDFAGMINYTKNKLLKQRFDFSCGKSIDPKYMIGEKVYLKEPDSIIADYEKGLITKYKFDYPPTFSHKWSNKLFMPESAARYFIEITAVRAERLQDILEEDCMKEGIIPNFSLTGGRWRYFIPDKLNEPYHSPVEAYAALINKISGKGTWEKNPFVWVYDFRLTTK